MVRALLAVSVISLLPLAACGPKLIPGTDITATDDNQAIVDVLDNYRRAVEAKNVEGIMKLVSSDFFEDAGTPDGKDDYSYAQLEERLKGWADSVRQVRMELNPKSIVVAEDGNTAQLRYFYDINFQLVGGEGQPDKWEHDSDFDEMTLKKVNGAWKITSGL